MGQTLLLEALPLQQRPTSVCVARVASRGEEKNTSPISRSMACREVFAASPKFSCKVQNNVCRWTVHVRACGEAHQQTRAPILRVLALRYSHT